MYIRVLDGFLNELVEAVDFLRRKIMFVGFVRASNETFLDNRVLVHANNLNSFISCLDQLLKRWSELIELFLEDVIFICENKIPKLIYTQYSLSVHEKIKKINKKPSRPAIQNNFFLLVEARHNWNNFDSLVLCVSTVTGIAISSSGNKNNALAVFTNCQIMVKPLLKIKHGVCRESNEFIETV